MPTAAIRSIRRPLTTMKLKMIGTATKSPYNTTGTPTTHFKIDQNVKENNI